jgi:FtsH-binding integral membrane protein
MGWRQTFIYSLFGAILFSLLIVYDTFLISKRLSPDEVHAVVWGSTDHLFLGKN